MKRYTKMTSELIVIILKVGMLKGVPVFNGRYHRRTGYFLAREGGGGGGCKPFAQKIRASCPNFYKTVGQKLGAMQQHRPYWHMKMARYSFSGSITAKFEHKLRRHKQTFGKIATTVVLSKNENLL